MFFRRSRILCCKVLSFVALSNLTCLAIRSHFALQINFRVQNCMPILGDKFYCFHVSKGVVCLLESEEKFLFTHQSEGTVKAIMMA